jgi:ABC-type Mn2+/Zn2+ transport system ATPase subunit
MTEQIEQFKIRIENCNSIDLGEISLLKGRLNIKYGPNGIGKSTIAKAMVSQIKQDGTLDALTPFKRRGKDKQTKPKVDGATLLKSALVFDEDYVNQFVFQQDEVVKNSFDIFIKTPEYLASMNEIEQLLEGIKKAFSSNLEIDQTIKDLKELRDAFGTSKTGAIPKNCKIHKAFGSGNKIDNIPESIKSFEPFIKSKEPSKWISWQVQGNKYIALGNTCPYCATELADEKQKETALAVEKEYDVKSVDHLNTLKAIIERLGKYFSAKCKESLDKVTTAKIELTAQEQGFLSGLKIDIQALILKLEDLREISFFSLRDVDDIEDKVTRLNIDLDLIEKLDSTETRKVVNPINNQLQELLTKIGILKGNIGKHKARIKEAIEENQESINGFLKSAGYKYSVKIIPEAASYKMKLIHNDFSEHIEAAAKHLSYGEKNAFSLVLFMHQVLSEKPDLVVLDDPISSFDKNKKFAILHQLFRGKASLKGRTTIMLTHDIEPAIDVIKGTARVFQGSYPTVTFLTCKAGKVTETPIKREDIQTFAQICRHHIASLQDTVIKAIYLRRHHEILDEMGNEYNLLASLFHKRDVPTIKNLTVDREMTKQERSCYSGD